MSLRQVLTLSSLCACAAVFLQPLHASTLCDAHAYGAHGDAHTKDTAELQKAIDACAAKGGGTVRLSGDFLSGPLILRSNIILDIEPGSTLRGSADHSDYPRITELRAAALQPLLSSEGAQNIVLSGGGTIDGQGQSWWQQARAERDHGIVGEGNPRPRLIVLNHSKHVRIENLTIENAPFWQIVPYYSDDVTIQNVKILADPHSPNTDAIDPFSSTHVVIDHVYADVGDDNIAIKSGLINSPGPDSPSADITITNCTFAHGHGLSIGSEIAGGAQRIHISHITFDGTEQGIRIKANRDRGADVSDIRVDDVNMHNVSTPILISEYYPKVLPAEGEEPQPVGRLTPHFHNIAIRNLTARGAKKAGVIVGLPESPVEDLQLDNVKIEAATGMYVAFAKVAAHGLAIKPSTGDPVIAGPAGVIKQR